MGRLAPVWPSPVSMEEMGALVKLLPLNRIVRYDGAKIHNSNSQA